MENVVNSERTVESQAMARHVQTLEMYHIIENRWTGQAGTNICIGRKFEGEAVLPKQDADEWLSNVGSTSSIRTCTAGEPHS